jgi:hypothetical protein
MQNMIASGEHPMLVDLEALFHPVMEGSVTRDESDALIFQAYVRSVMLPQAGEEAATKDLRVGCIRLREVWRQAAGVGVGAGGRKLIRMEMHA